MKNAIPAAGHFRLKGERLAGVAFRKTREFDLQVSLPPYHNNVVLDVLNSLETDEVMGFDENDTTALKSTPDSDLYAKATTGLSIRRWLPAGCQVIRWATSEEFVELSRKRGFRAVYTSNAAQVMFPIGVSHIPIGPSAFVGQIIVNSDEYQFKDDENTGKQLRFVLAHELTHVFDMLRLLVPALRNWRRFWHKFLQDGQRCGAVIQLHSEQSVFVDDYGSENELKTIREYWPSRADGWFNAFRKT